MFSMDTYSPNLDLADRIGNSVTPPGKMLAEIFRKAADLCDNPDNFGSHGGWYIIPGSTSCIYLAVDRRNGPLRVAVTKFYDGLFRKGHPREPYSDLFYFESPEDRAAARKSFIDAAEAAKKLPSGWIAKFKWRAAEEAYRAGFHHYPH